MALAPEMERAVGGVIEKWARWLAYAGGVLLAGVSVMVVLSVIGRALDGFGLRPIRGDYELVQTGVALAVFAFLPWCQFNRGHVSVDILVTQFPQRSQAFFGLIGDTLITLSAFIIAWRIWIGFGEKFPFWNQGLRDVLGMGTRPFFPETTYELAIPMWIPYGLGFLFSALFLLTSLYSVWRSLNWTLQGRENLV
jgi:TRAP-type C4-dicarboxylate transport system permease small subunit